MSDRRSIARGIAPLSSFSTARVVAPFASRFSLPPHFAHGPGLMVSFFSNRDFGSLQAAQRKWNMGIDILQLSMPTISDPTSRKKQTASQNRNRTQITGFQRLTYGRCSGGISSSTRR